MSTVTNKGAESRASSRAAATVPRLSGFALAWRVAGIRRDAPLASLDGASSPRCELTIQVPDLRGSRYGRVVLAREVWT
jgi:hypothetical protein